MKDLNTPEAPKKEERTMLDIQNQYTSLCNKAGHLQYQLSVFKKDLEIINSSLRDLNFEAAALQAKEAEAAAATTVPTEVTPIKTKKAKSNEK